MNVDYRSSSEPQKIMLKHYFGRMIISSYDSFYLNAVLRSYSFLLILVVPIYSSMAGSMAWIYSNGSFYAGMGYFKRFLFSPITSIPNYFTLVDFWFKNHTYGVQVLTVPIFAFLFSLYILFFMRAKLMNFKLFKEPEITIGSTKRPTETYHNKGSTELLL